MKVYDLRSDTVTRPSEGMRKAMYEAEVGDDVYHEDPSVNRLEELAAEITGKEKALFVTSGSMGNLIPVYLNCGHGNEFLIDYRGHMIHYELASVSAIAGALPVPVVTERGILSSNLLEKKVRPDIYYMARTRMVVVENTHNLAGGTFYTKEELGDINTFAETHSLKIHMDGARLFNASIASGLKPEEICGFVDTVTFCLSKGLGAPVGALLCGERAFVDEARRVRKMLGGGMRQAGILAAAGIYALENNVDKLAEDHVKAKMIAEVLAQSEWAVIDPGRVVTNIVYFGTGSYNAYSVVEKLRERGVLCGAIAPDQIRMVTHLDVSLEDVREVCNIIADLNLEGEVD